MATEEASSSSPPLHGNPPPLPSTDIAASASSAIDFLTLCHRLKPTNLDEGAPLLAFAFSLVTLNEIGRARKRQARSGTTKRTGWVQRRVKDPESIADHMYRMGIMALISSDIPGVNRDKCIKMAIVHDIAEAIVGDITPYDGISKSEKLRREQEALDHMCKLLGGGSRAQEISELWMDYENNSSPEAKIVKDLDKVEMILQALEYENEQGKDLDEFFQSTAGT
uniref:5'-deoxynucleotidase n=1 Tax=Cucumis melo TaxID=3656 RepID=A0A9I9CIF9_CUCME